MITGRKAAFPGSTDHLQIIFVQQSLESLQGIGQFVIGITENRLPPRRKVDRAGPKICIPESILAGINQKFESLLAGPKRRLALLAVGDIQSGAAVTCHLPKVILNRNAAHTQPDLSTALGAPEMLDVAEGDPVPGRIPKEIPEFAGIVRGN